MPVRRFDLHAGSIETLESERSSEGFLKMHGIVARTGVLYYQDAHGVSSELIPPEELFAEDSLATLGGKPFTDDHPRDDNGAPLLVTPDNSEEHTRGTVGNDIAGKQSQGFVRITLDAHQKGIISKIDAGKRQLSSGRLVERIDETPGVWDASTQQYWLGDDAIGKPGVKFDRVQRGFTHNHVALVDRGRAGPRVSLRLDSADAVQVEPPSTNGGRNMAKVRIDGVEHEVDSGVAVAIAAQQTAHKTRIDGLDTKVKTLEAGAVKATADLDASKLKADDLQKKLDAVDPKALVQARLKLERSVAHLKLDGLDAMSDREVMVAAIKKLKADYDDTDVSDEHVAIYFEARMDALGVDIKTDDGGGRANSARHDASSGNDREKRIDAYVASNPRGYKARLVAQKEARG